MKRGVITALIGMIGLAGTSVCFAQKGGSTAASMKTTIDSVSYVIGMNIGKTMRTDSIALNPDILRAGMLDASQGKATVISDSLAQMVLARFQQEATQRFQQRQMQEMAAKGAENQKKGEAFLNANKSKPGVKVTPSGLQYTVMAEGSGESPDANDEVSVNYSGTLIDGTLFDKSQPGKPVQFPVNGVIKGWTEALQMMKPGAKWKLFIPANLAYGPSGAGGGKIGPSETLIFEVELLSVTKK